MEHIEYILANGGCRGVCLEAIPLLLPEGVEQNKIRAWCKKNPHNGLAKMHNRDIPDGAPHCEGWEATFLWVVDTFSWFNELTLWDTTSSANRLAHRIKVTKLARELANELKGVDKPHYPPVLAFFEEDKAMDIINRMPKETAHSFLKYTKHGDSSSEHYEESVSQALACRFVEPQELPDLLERLANYAEREIHSKKPIARPNTGDANARAFALYMAEQIKEAFDRTPNEVIAACVCLKYPELENPPNADTIRDWRGAK